MIFKTAAEIASKMSRSSFSGHLVEYKVVVVTGSERHSGTDSCVFVKLVGDGGDSGEVELEKSENFNKFEKGQVDTFTFHSKVALGRVQQVFVRIDSSGNLVKKNWLLKSIEVSGGDLAGAVEFNHGAVLTPEYPTAVLVGGLAADASQLSLPKFQKMNGAFWSYSELARVEQSFRSCSKNYVQDRR